MLFRADFVRQEHVPGSMNAGKKGEEFAAAVRDLDSARKGSPGGAWLFVHHHNTSSSIIYTGCRAIRCRTTIILHKSG